MGQRGQARAAELWDPGSTLHLGVDSAEQSSVCMCVIFHDSGMSTDERSHLGCEGGGTRETRVGGSWQGDVTDGPNRCMCKCIGATAHQTSPKWSASGVLSSLLPESPAGPPAAV